MVARWGARSSAGRDATDQPRAAAEAFDLAVLRGRREIRLDD
jgi:hypothetical protein